MAVTAESTGPPVSGTVRNSRNRRGAPPVSPIQYTGTPSMEPVGAVVPGDVLGGTGMTGAEVDGGAGCVVTDGDGAVVVTVALGVPAGGGVGESARPASQSVPPATSATAAAAARIDHRCWPDGCWPPTGPASCASERIASRRSLGWMDRASAASASRSPTSTCRRSAPLNGVAASVSASGSVRRRLSSEFMTAPPLG
jgi:hypothetical protein